MKPMSKNNRAKSRRVWISLILLVLMAAGGFGYYFWNQQNTAQQTADNTGFNTTQVRQGTISISASGSGTLAAGKESPLSFSASGTVAKLNVQVGDQVTEGQVLAQLGNLDELQENVNSAQQDLVAAQQELATLQQNSSANLANAQIKLIDAKKAVDDAKSAVVQEGWVRCDQKTLDAYYYNYTHAQEVLKDLGDGGGGQDYYLKIIVPQKNIVAQAKAAYEYCAGYTDYEISSSQATVSLTNAELTLAQTSLSTLTENNGVDPIELATAQNKVDNAKLALEQAKETLAGATLTAPFNGTILSVAGTVGDTAGTDTFITIADLAHPLVNFSVDETDMSKVVVGESATIAFDAISGRTFNGTVTRINPALETSNGYQVVTGVIQLDLSKETDLPTLAKGLNGTVELVPAKAENVLIIPLQALHDLGDGTYSVFVVGTDGQPKLKMVEIGLQDAASVEIKSGLSAGDIVTTGTTQTR
jgi:HlyD family secretion protein